RTPSIASNPSPPRPVPAMRAAVSGVRSANVSVELWQARGGGFNPPGRPGRPRGPDRARARRSLRARRAGPAARGGPDFALLTGRRSRAGHPLRKKEAFAFAQDPLATAAAIS